MDETPSDPGNVDQYLQMEGLIQALGASSADQEKRDTLNKQIQMAQMLRQGPNMPHGQFIPGSHGGVYVAPNALQDAASVANYGAATLSDRHALDQMNSMNDTEAQNRQKIMAMILSQNGGMRPPMAGSDVSGAINDIQPASVNMPPPPVAPSGGQDMSQILHMIYPNMRKKSPPAPGYDIQDNGAYDQAGNPVMAIGPT